MQTIIYFFRHGDYENPKDILHLRLPGFPLSAEGKKQAQKLAKACQNIPFSAAITSPLTRAKQTAEILAKPHHLTLEDDDRLMDLISPLQGKPLNYLRSINFDFYRPEFLAQGGESLEQALVRMQAVVSDVLDRFAGKQVFLVSHGDPLMAIKVYYQGLPVNLVNIRQNYVPVAAGFRVTFSGKKASSVAQFP